ncbi:MAG: alanine dehydrogenase [Verrucomicrobiota bacterium]
MIIGIPKEIKELESRVALIPSGVYQLVKLGHTVLIEKDAGLGSGFANEEYEAAGSEILAKHEEVFERADLIVKVKEPLPEEYSLLRKDQLLFTFLHLAADKKLTEVLMDTGVTAIAYETVERNGHLPVLEPMSEIAGRMSVIVGGYYLSKPKGGRGVLLGGVPGVLPGKVVVLGGGTCGVNAARMATGLGADVTILEVDIERMRYLDISMRNAHTFYSNEAHLMEILPHVDLLIGAVLLPGAKAPKLVTREMLKSMKPGSVVVDVAVDQGGCVETTKPTTHTDPTYFEEDILHYCVANMPGAYSRSATEALTNINYTYVELLAQKGLAGACKIDDGLKQGVNVMDGQIRCRAVADAHSLDYAPIVT